MAPSHCLNQWWPGNARSQGISNRGVTIHLVMIRLVLRYTACDTFHDTIFVIHISDVLLIQDQLIKTEETGFMFRLVTVCTVIYFYNKKIPIFDDIKSSQLSCLCFYILIALLFLCKFSEPVPVWLSLWFFWPLDQVSFVSIQAPTIWYTYH